ncbi:hypothetical protein ACFL0C_00035 [Patescibacteria group bacterium]
MNKKLIAKIQKLVPTTEDSEVEFSTCIAIEPPERELVLKKGSIYTVFNIKSNDSLNTSLISKLVNDVLYDAYYQSENISPIQSLEKAIVNINDKLTNLAAQEQLNERGISKKEKNVEFNIVAGVLWGNVLYIVQYGEGKSFLMRESDITEVSATSEGNFSVASGVVNDDDVVILSTKNFADKFPPKKLLSAAISSNDLKADQSCLILKFMIDSNFSESEAIDFGIEKNKKTPKIADLLSGIKKKASKKGKKEQTIQTLAGTISDKPEKPTVAKKEKVEEVKVGAPDMNTLVIEPTKDVTNEKTPKEDKKILAKNDEPKKTELAETKNKEPSTLPEMPIKAVPTAIKQNKPNIKLKSAKNFKTKINVKTMSIFVLLLLIVSLGATAIIRSNKGSKEEPQPENKESLTLPKEPDEEEGIVEEPQGPTPEEIAAEDATNKVERVTSQPFYDIKLADENAEPQNITLFTNSVVVTDTKTGKIFVSQIDTPKFSAEETAFSNISSTVNFEGSLGFVDEEGYKIYDLVNQTIKSSYTGTFGLSAPYLGNIYSIEGTEIVKYVLSGGEAQSSTWGESADFENAKAIDIAYNIYVITNDDSLVVYSQGVESNFTVSDLEVPFKGATDVVTDVNFNNIYIADSGNKRVVVLDNEGNFIKQYKADKEEIWENIKAISVNSSETKMFMLAGSRVYEIDLETQ